MITSDFILMFIMTFVMIANILYLHIWLTKFYDLVKKHHDYLENVLAEFECFRISFERVCDDIREGFEQ